jgi:hypothetical protein
VGGLSGPQSQEAAAAASKSKQSDVIKLNLILLFPGLY